MAVIPEYVSRSVPNPFQGLLGDALPPAGTYLATIIDIKDMFAVTHAKWQEDYNAKPTMITEDMTCFLFGYRDGLGAKHMVATKPEPISGNMKSNLYKFLNGLLGVAPRIGWDYMELKGKQCQITVEHVAKKNNGGFYAKVKSAFPLPVGGFATPPPVAQQSQAYAPPPPPALPTPVYAQQQPQAYAPTPPPPAQAAPVNNAPYPQPQPVYDAAADETLPF